MTSDPKPPRDGERVGVLLGAYAEAIAYRIRAELVCCDLYQRVEKARAEGDGENAIGRAVLRKDWHDLCYWGEASAQIAEGRCPGYETEPNVCRCPCEGCKHNCGAHDEETPWQPTS